MHNNWLNLLSKKSLLLTTWFTFSHSFILSDYFPLLIVPSRFEQQPLQPAHEEVPAGPGDQLRVKLLRLWPDSDIQLSNRLGHRHEHSIKEKHNLLKYLPDKEVKRVEVWRPWRPLNTLTESKANIMWPNYPSRYFSTFLWCGGSWPRPAAIFKAGMPVYMSTLRWCSWPLCLS